MTGANLLDKKIIAVSNRRGITIPKKFYSKLNLTNEVECFVRGNELIIRTANHSCEDFSDLIEAELSEQGFDGEDFSNAFNARKAELKTSLQAMLEDARQAANGKGEYFTMDEIFGGE